MLVNKYLVLHSGDRILMSRKLKVLDIKKQEEYFNLTLEQELKDYKRDVQDAASHIELVLSHKES